MEAPQSNGRDERWGHVKEVIENSASTTLCFTKLYYTTSYCTIRYYLYYTIQCNTIQYYTILYYTILYILYLWQVVHIHKTSFLIYYCNILYNLCKLVEYIKLSFYDIYISQTLQFPMERYCPVKKIIFSNDLKLINFFWKKKNSNL